MAIRGTWRRATGHRGTSPWGARVVAGALGLLAAVGAGEKGAGKVAWAGEAPGADAGAPAPEETPKQEFARIEAAVKAHLQAKDEAALQGDLALLKEHGETCTEAALRPKYLALLGTILQTSRAEEVRKAALRTIGETKNEALFKYLRPHLGMPDPKRAPPLLLTAVEAAGVMAADDAAGPLVALVKDSKVMPVAQAALKALAGFGSNKRLRVKILDDVLSTVRKDRPGVGTRPDTSSGTPVPTARVRTGDETMSRWEALSPVLVETLNRMTGQNVGSAEDWFDFYDRYKNQPNAIFTSPSGATSSDG